MSQVEAQAAEMPSASHATIAHDSYRYLLIAIIAFLTLVDLFATQAILPSLARKYDVSPATMGVAVNASTFGMAIAGLLIAFFGRDLDRRNGIWISLAVLAIPTVLLAFVESIGLFAVLRVAQGLCMASAFTLTMAYLAEHFTAGRATAALSAYVTGNVASNVFGRMLSATVADQLGIATNFLVFAGLNLCGAALVYVTLMRASKVMKTGNGHAVSLHDMAALFANRQLSGAFAIGFLILFAFIGTYTYVNFRLTAPEIGLGAMTLGFVYLVFLPSLVTTPLAGAVANRLGTPFGIASTLAIAVVGMLLCLPANLPVVLLGLTLVAIGTFLAQAMATGFVGRTAASDQRAAASGIYLSSYYAGGLAGSFVLGQVYVTAGWAACVWVLVGVLTLGMLAARLLVKKGSSAA
jgi:predicted MFS family arabinose efflux permease